MASNLVIPVMCTPADSGVVLATATADVEPKHTEEEHYSGGLVTSMLSRWLLSTNFYSSVLHHQRYRPPSTSTSSAD